MVTIKNIYNFLQLTLTPIYGLREKDEKVVYLYLRQHNHSPVLTKF